MLKETNTPSRPRIEPGSPDPKSDALTIRPVRPPRVDIMGRVLDPLLCVFLADIQSVGIGACMHVCVWYTELTCISNRVSKTDIVVG